MGMLPGIIAFGLVGLGCLLFVVYKMWEYDGPGAAFFGLITGGLYALVWGWQNADVIEVDRFMLRDVMLAASLCLGTSLFFMIISSDGAQGVPGFELIFKGGTRPMR